MLQDYSISSCTRRCSVSKRPLEPGESFYSVIIRASEGVTRIDIASSHWEQPPENAIGWWKSRMPQAAAQKLRPAPNGVLLDTLSDLVERPGKEALSYLLALLLVRRRVLTDETRLEIEPDHAEVDEAREWNLVCQADGRVWTIPTVELDPAALPALQDELNTLLFTEE